MKAEDKIIMTTRYALLLCLATAGLAQDRAAVGGPVSGIVFDQNAQALRPVLGIPGAAYLAAPLVSGIDAAAVSPDGSSALAVVDGRLSLIAGLKNLAPAIAPIEGALSAVDRFAWSPDGATAAVYSSRDNRFQVLSDLRKTPAAGPAIDAAIEGTVTALAVDRAGEVLAGAASGDAGGVYLLGPDGPRLILKAGTPVALVFANGERDLYVADRTGQRIWSVQGFAGAAAAVVFADGVSSPVGLQLSADGKRIFVASAETRALSVLDTASGASLGSLELDCAPTGLRAFGSDVWLLNSDRGSEEPLYVIDGAGEPAAWFVPAGRQL